MISSRQGGQVLIGAIILLVLLSIALPALVRYTQNESIWTQKDSHSTKAFQLAEAAAEQGFQQLLLSSTAWTNTQAANPPAGFNFDQTYSAPGGTYEIRLKAGASASLLEVTGVAKSNGEIRAVKSIYTNSGVGNSAITAGNTVTVGASVNVEWGAVMSYNSITAGGRAHPRFYSTGSIDLDSNGSTPPNTDGVQWWSYQTNMPSQPQLNLAYYKAQAQAAGASPAGCPSYYSNPGTGVNTFCSLGRSIL